MFGCAAAAVRFAGLNTSKVYFNVLVSLSHSVCIIIIASEIISNPTIKLIIDYIVLCPLCPTFIGVEAGGGGARGVAAPPNFGQLRFLGSKRKFVQTSF